MAGQAVILIPTGIPKGNSPTFSFVGKPGCYQFFGGLTSLFYIFGVGSFTLAMVGGALMAFGIYVVYRTWKYYGLVETPIDIRKDFGHGTIFLLDHIYPSDFGLFYGLWYPALKLLWSYTHSLEQCGSGGSGIYSTVWNIVDRRVIVPQRKCHETKLTTPMMAFCIGYMALTFVNKYYIDQIFEETLQKEGIVAKRYMTNPTILNNVLWSATAETDSLLSGILFSLWQRKNLSWCACPNSINCWVRWGDSTIEILNGLATIIIAFGKAGRKVTIQRHAVRSTKCYQGRHRWRWLHFKFVVVKDKQGRYRLDRDAGRPPAVKKRDDGDVVARIRGIWR